MDEGGVDHAIAGLGASSEAVQVRERAALNIGSHRSEGRRVGIGAGKTEDFVSCRDQFLDSD